MNGFLLDENLPALTLPTAQAVQSVSVLDRGVSDSAIWDHARAHDLAEAIRYWAEDKKARRSAGARGRDRVAAHFTRRRMLDAYMEAIEKVLVNN